MVRLGSIPDSFQRPQYFNGLYTACAIIMRPFCRIPGIKMPSNGNDLFRKFSALPFADHIVPYRIRQAF